MKKYIFLVSSLVTLCGITILFLPPALDLQDREREEFLDETTYILPPFDPVVNIPVSKAEDAWGQLSPKELVIGVTINGQARAYPLNMIDAPQRKVINDELSGESILVTWCDLCHTAAVFSRKLGSNVELFGCSGLLWNNTLVIYDEKTRSFWNHLIGECVAGDRRGEKLTPIPSVITSWKSWHDQYPETTVLVADRVTQILDLDYYQDSVEGEEIVYGFREPEDAPAWTFDFLGDNPVLNTFVDEQPSVIFFNPDERVARSFSSCLGNQELTFDIKDGQVIDLETGSAWNILSGRSTSGALKGKYLNPVPGATAFTDQWKRHFPDSVLNPGGGVFKPDQESDSIEEDRLPAM